MRRYHHQLPQRALGHLSPVQALKDWQEKCPELFKRKVYNLTGLDIYHINIEDYLFSGSTILCRAHTKDPRVLPNIKEGWAWVLVKVACMGLIRGLDELLGQLPEDRGQPYSRGMDLPYAAC